MTPETITFLSDGDTIDAWHFAGAPDHPVVVMAHGFGGTKDSGLAGFAEPLAAAGFHVLAFDYRGFGSSSGTPRQTVSVAGQLADYRAAVDAARKLPGVDPAKVVLWGVSLSGGHVFAVAAGRDDIAAVIALTPLVDGAAAGRLALKHHKVGDIARSTVLGLRSRIGEARMMPLVAAPGGGGALSLDGALEELHRDRRADLAQRGRRRRRPRARQPPARQAGQAGHRPRAGAGRRLRPQRAAAGRDEGGVQGAGPGAPLPVRPLRRLGRLGLPRVRRRAPGAVPAAAVRDLGLRGGVTHYDVLVVGSGFGGSVTALRLSEKGYRVGVLETGRRWTDADFAAQGSRDVLWAPRLGMLGPMRLSMLGEISLFSAVGVGGGSLIYANTLYEPHDAFFDDPSWSGITDWRAELAPYYDQARRMLGVTTNPRLWPADEMMREVATELGAGETFQPTDVGVLFDESAPGRAVPDPFFGGAGPERTACVHCARCTSGCPFGAKNTLPKNYLHLAEEAGAVVHPLCEVTDVRPRAGGGFDVTTRRPGRGRAPGPHFTADQVVVSAAARGTQLLLHTLKAGGSLPDLSPRLGELSRSNSEAIVNLLAHEPADFDRGVTITSSFHPEPHTHVELCRSNEVQTKGAVMNVPLVDGGPGRLRRFVVEQARRPGPLLRTRRLRDVSQRTLVLLVMQSVDNSLTSYLRRGRLRTRVGSGAPNPSWLPIAHDVARRFAARIGADPVSLASDLIGSPATAHYIGGAVIGETADTGVVDPYHRVHGYPGLHVVDGSTIGANLGVNPALTITAMAERATSLWPNKGDADPRPALGEPYERVTPVAPHSPAVPATAPAALTWA